MDESDFECSICLCEYNCIKRSIQWPILSNFAATNKNNSVYPTWKRNDIILAYNDPLPDWVFTTEDSYLRHKERQSFISTFYIRIPGTDKKSKLL